MVIRFLVSLILVAQLLTSQGLASDTTTDSGASTETTDTTETAEPAETGDISSEVNSVWDDTLSCVLNPCICLSAGFGNRYEEWDGETLDKGPANYNCPPFGKEVGREDNICLAGMPYPGNVATYFEAFCGEESPDNDYFNYKITMRAQHCNAIACWTESHDLEGNGACVTMTGGYVWPLHRMCARVAFPGELLDGENMTDDPGYTRGQHLNFEGATKDDEPLPTSDGGEIVLDLPKLCLYRDPSMYTVDQSIGDAGIDWLDLDPVYQPVHYYQTLSPIMEALIFATENAGTFITTPLETIGSLFDFLDTGVLSILTVSADAMISVISFVSDLTTVLGVFLVDQIKEYGQLNRIVDSTIYGCVNIPLGPYPPPFCETISIIPVYPTTHYVCHNDKEGELVTSVEGNECVVSRERNNYLHNTIRISYDNFVPLCANEEDPSETDLCVEIDNIEIVSAPSLMHTITEKYDVINNCTNSSGGPCVRTMLDNSEFRVVYGKSLGTYTMPSPYYRDDLMDCSTERTINCQKIWGVNTGEYVDVSMHFTDNSSGTDLIAPLTATAQLNDTEGNSKSFTASIVTMVEFDPVASFTQDPNEICVTEGEDVVGCQPRAPKPQILLYECGSGVIPGINCSSEFFNPRFIASYKALYRVGPGEDDILFDQVSGVAEPLSYHASTGGYESVVNLAGNELEAFITDDSFAQKPFSGPNAPSPLNLFGQYRNDIFPVDASTVTTNANAVYIGGLEYINGQYYTGGQYACLTNTNYKRCPGDPTLCVLTNLTNRDVVSCSSLAAKQALYPGLDICTVDQASTCSPIDSIETLSGDGVVEIKQCSDGIKCYDHPEILCGISTNPDDREEPSASLGNTLSDSQYYNTMGTPLAPGMPPPVIASYDKDLFAMRDKTAIELGYCVAIQGGTCPEQTDYSEDNGFAYWPEAEYGQESLGTCPEGFEPEGELSRTCIADPISKQFILEPLYYWEDDGSGNQQKRYINMRCVPTTP